MRKDRYISLDDLKILIKERDEAISANNAFSDKVKNPESRKKMFEHLPPRIEQYSTIINNGTTFVDNGRRVSRYGSIGNIGRFYRGENRIYPETKSKFVRELDNDEAKIDILSKLIVQQIKILFIDDYIRRIKNISHWKIGGISTDLIAQHYGLSTAFLDLTDDIRVALFFACTKTDDSGDFHYLNEWDLNNDYGREGVVHIINKGLDFNLDIKQIGYQPFTRCHRQRGYYIDTYNVGLEKFDLNNYEGATKYVFRRTEKFCKSIYDYFDSGSFLFPLKEKRTMTKIIDLINTKKLYNNKDFHDATSILKKEHKGKVTFELLKKHGYDYFEGEHIFDQSILSEIDLLDLDKFVKNENINPINLITRF